MLNKLYLVSFLLFISFAYNCSGDSGDSLKGVPISDLIGGVEPNFSSKIISFSDCSGLEDFYKKQMIKSLRMNAYQQISYWRPPSDFLTVSDEPTASPEDSGNGSGVQPIPLPQGGSTETPDYSKTNVQEAGVDEADLVKTDGHYLYVANQRGIYIIDISTPSSPVETSFTRINPISQGVTNVSGIYIYNDELVVITVTNGYGDGWYIGEEYAKYPGSPAYRSKVHFYDIADKTKPRLKHSLWFEDFIVTSRRIQNYYYFVSRSNFRVPVIAYPKYADTYDGHVRSVQDALNRNIENISRLDLSHFFPETELNISSGGGTKKMSITDNCSGWKSPESGNGASLFKVTSLRSSPLGTNPEVKTAGVVANWGNVYMSLGSLYYASSNNWFSIGDLGFFGQSYEPLTGVYKFKMASNGVLEYSAVGMVPGWVNDQFSMSEYDGFLRIGTTLGLAWRGQNISNQLSILKQEGSRLSQTGVISNIAPSERIYSMRYDRDRGYMVTFRQTDPLFTFDLSDPYQPKIAGELKVNGFSTYIHLFGESNNRLLTIGRSADDNGRVTGNQLQIFDVADMKSPRQVAVHELGDVYTQAVSNHHAFTYYAPKNALVIPYYAYNYTYSSRRNRCGYESGSQIFDVQSNQLTLRKKLLFGNEVFMNVNTCANISIAERNVFVGDHLFVISRDQIMSADFTSLTNKVFFRLR